MSSGLDSYDNGTKRNWRGWQWNRIVERLSVSVEEATVLYLCGPDDFDRQKALDRGFRNENVIAIDFDQANIDAVRRRGGVGFSGDLHDAIRGWPSDWPIDVVVADYCAGLSRSTFQLAIELVFAPAVARPGHPTVVSANFQRGRDPWSNTVRRHTSSEATKAMQADGVDDPSKHRGWQFIIYYTWEMVQQLVHMGASEREARRRVSRALNDLHSKFNTYRSNRVKMDSVVFVPLTRVVEGDYPGDDVAEIRRKIAAARAVRTMKVRAA